MTDDFERDPLARELRDSLARHAASAPPGDALAERIIHATERPTDRRERRHRGWRTWALPLAAGGAVAAVVGTVIGIESYHPTATGPASTGSASILQSQLPTPTPSPTSTSAPSPAATTPVGAPDLAGVKIRDLTFAYGQGWALASADCQSGPGVCTALLHTTDGTDWKSMPGAQFNVPGVSAGCPESSDKCVTSIRFANTQVGYAFGPSAFFMTQDGGATWDQQRGGAAALETYSQNVIRVTASPPSGCPGPCNVQVETSDVGSSTWRPATLPGSPSGYGVQLARGGNDAYLLFFGHPAGGSSIATSVLYRSTDDGRTWQSAGEPCPQTNQEIDSTAIAAGGDTVSVLCMVRQAPQRWHVATSTDAGASFTAQPGEVPAATSEQLTGDPTTELVAAGDGMVRSTDGGKTWQSVPDVTGHVTWVGFEDAKNGRAVTDNNTIWTTQDGGKSWTPVRFN